ncbi:MAG: trigger factor [Anaerorhabdus sp.]
MSNWTILEKSKGELTTTLDGVTWKEACTKAFDKLAKEVEIPGFRKGQAPKNLVEKQVSQNNVYIEAIESLANQALIEGIEEHQLTLVARPELKINSFTADQAEIGFILVVKPEVKLGEYKGIEYKVEGVTVEDAEIDAEIETLRERFVDMIAKDGSAENGDTVVIDFLGKKDGVAFDGGAAQGHQLELGSRTFIPGFEEQLVGVKAGDKKDIDITFPEDYHAAELAGAPVVFEVTVHEVTRKEIPNLDDEFAKDVNAPNVETLADLKEHIRKDLESSKTERAENSAMDQLMSQVVDGAEVDIPEEMIREETDQMIQEFAQRIQQQGVSLSAFLEMTGQKSEDLREQMGQDASKKVKLRLVLEEVAKQENLEVEESEIEEEYKSISEQYHMEVDKLKEMIQTTNLKYDIRLRKAYELIKDSAKK